MFGVPLWARAAHVMLLRMIAVEQLAGHGEPHVSDGLADGWGFSVLGHDTFPSSRRVPTAGSAFWSRSMSAWFRDMLGPNWLKFVTTLQASPRKLRISFPKIYRRLRHIRAHRELRCERLHVSDGDFARAD